MVTIIQETFTHGSIAMMCADNDNYYVSLFYFRHRKHKTVTALECVSFHGFNAFNKAVTAYENMREYMGRFVHTVKGV